VVRNTKGRCSIERSSAIIVSLHTAVAAAAKATCSNDEDLNAIRESLFNEILRVADASSRIAACTDDVNLHKR